MRRTLLALAALVAAATACTNPVAPEPAAPAPSLEIVQPTALPVMPTVETATPAALECGVFGGSATC